MCGYQLWETCVGDFGLFVEMADIGREKIERPIKVVKENKYVFLLFTNRQREDNLFIRNNKNTCIWNDIILSSFYLLSGWEERFIHRDRNDRPEVQESFLYREKILHDPIINQYSTLLRDLFRASHHQSLYGHRVKNMQLLYLMMSTIQNDSVD